ncbi:uncharacterized protein LOC141689941 [Apium graveolens]|uniref:uncharacterized protein LOC141689941 n=1 Tax=Apium graveolens TaxID=4045 RepID=UPI003D7B8D6A
MSKPSTLYLFLYNLLQAYGWGIALVKILSNLAETKSITGAYASAGQLICLLQTVAILETIHGAIGIVGSGVLMPLMQWGGRTHVLVAVAHGIKEVQEFSAVFIMLVSFCLVEVIRYSNYALNCFNMSPYFLTYLRYTVFIVLFPIGVISEMWLMYEALPFIKKKNIYAKLFAGLPFSYSDFVKVLLCVYPFLWLLLFVHMFKQRRSKLGKRHKKKRN